MMMEEDNDPAMVRARAVFPFLRSCERECEEPLRGEKRGEIPRWLRGGLVRIGSGLLQIGPDRFGHVFDGMALMHRFEFGEGGEVTYRNRFLRSDAYLRNTSAQRIVTSEFGTRGAPDPCKTIFQRLSSVFDLDNMTDNDLVNIIVFGDEAYACSETNNVWRIDTETLKSLQKVNLTKYVPVDGAIAHAHEDADGTVYNLGTSFGFRSYYSILKFPPKGEKNGSPFANGSVVCKIPAQRTMRPSYFHSFAMTENYFVLVEQPLYMSLPKMAWSHFVAGTYSDAMSWDPDAQVQFHVVRRSDGRSLTTPYVAAPFFVFHHINAYESKEGGGQLIVDLCGYEKGDIVKALYVDALRDMFGGEGGLTDQGPFRSKARRYVLPLLDASGNTVKGKNLVSLPGSEATAVLREDGNVFCTFEVLTGETWSPELPRINYSKCNGRSYRYFYAIGRNDRTPQQTFLIKVDTESKRTVSWSEVDAVPSEPVFLEDPTPANEDEDSGVLLASLLYTDDVRKVSVLVLDAKTMSEIGRVTFRTEATVPGDFHGIFVPKTN